MIEIGENLESLLTTVAIMGALAVMVWATNRPSRRERRRKDEEG